MVRLPYGNAPAYSNAGPIAQLFYRGVALGGSANIRQSGGRITADLARLAALLRRGERVERALRQGYAAAVEAAVPFHGRKRTGHARRCLARDYHLGWNPSQTGADPLGHRRRKGLRMADHCLHSG